MGPYRKSWFVLLCCHSAVIAALAAVLLSDTPAAGAQAPKVYTIGILTDAMVPWHSTTEGFRDGLKALGYVQGSNVVFEARAAQADMRRVPALAAELIKLKPASPLRFGCLPARYDADPDRVHTGWRSGAARPRGQHRPARWERDRDREPAR